VSRNSNSDADIKAGKTPKKKNKKRDHIEKGSFMATLASIKKEKGIHDITKEKIWSVQRYVSKFYNHVLHLITFLAMLFEHLLNMTSEGCVYILQGVNFKL